jgi:hypothetical protein
MQQPARTSRKGVFGELKNRESNKKIRKEQGQRTEMEK